MSLFGDVRADITLLSGCPIILAALAALSRLLWKNRTTCSRLLVALVSAVFSKNPPKRCQDEAYVLMQEKLRRQKLDHFRILCHCLCGGLIIAELNVFNDIWVGRRQSSVPQDAILFGVHIVFLMVTFRPSVLTLASVDFVYCMLMIAISVAMTPFTCPSEGVIRAQVITTFGAVLLTSVLRTGNKSTMALPTLCNLLFIVCSASTIIQNGRTCILRPRMLALAQVAIVASATSGCFFLDRAIQHLMVNALQLEEAQELYSAACALLRSCCDVVVELNPAGALAGPSLELSSFLLHGASQSLQGTQLADLIVDDYDREEFLRRLAAPKLVGTGLAENMPVSIRDSDNNILRLELLWFQFSRLDGRLHTMIGLREFADYVSQRQHVQRREGVLSAGVNAMHQASSDPASTPTGSIAAEGLLAEEDFVLPELASVTSSSGSHVDPAVVVVDSFHPGFPIKGVTSGFCMRIGRLPVSTLFTNVVVNKEAFITWVELSVRALMQSLHPLADQQVSLLMPQGEMRAMCSIVPEAPLSAQSSGEDSEPGFDPENLCLRFHTIKRRRVNVTDDKFQRISVIRPRPGTSVVLSV